MKTKKFKKKAKFRLIRIVRDNAVRSPQNDANQSSLAAISEQLGDLMSLAKSMECLETFTKERLEAKSRDNLRIEGLKKIYSLACGNLKFLADAELDDGIYETLASVRRRMSYLKDSIGKLLNDEGVRPIVPSMNDAISESEHRIVQTIAPYSSECQAGRIAECLEIGFAVHGIVTPAEVVVFASQSEANGNSNN